jgi:hypothetical protein
MSAASKKASLEMDGEPSAARALEVLEAPIRAQRAAEQAEAAAGAPDAQRILRQAVATRIAALGMIEMELGVWFQARPMTHLAQLEEALGERNRAAIDRVVMASRRLQERVQTAAAEADRVRAVLEQPLDGSAVAAEIKAVQQLETHVPGLAAEHRRWQTLCAGVADQLSASVAIATAQATWMAGHD